jgi:hypothetical protein
MASSGMTVLPEKLALPPRPGKPRQAFAPCAAAR